MVDVFPGSLLDVAGVFVAVLQERFKQDGVPWRWLEKYERTDAQEGTLDAPSPIAVSSAYAEEDDFRDVLPRVIVSVPQANLQQIAVGNKAAVRTTDRTEVFTAFDLLPVSVECRGKTAGEASVVADVVRTGIACTKNGIRELFGFHDITLPSMTAPIENVNYFNAVVNFQITVQVKWRTTPLAPRLQEIAARINQGQSTAQQLALYNNFTR